MRFLPSLFKRKSHERRLSVAWNSLDSRQRSVLMELASYLGNGIDGDRTNLRYIDLVNHVRVDPLDSYEKYIKTGTGQVWATFVACNLVANVLVSTTFQVVKSGSGTPLDGTKHPLAKLIAQPNEWDSWEDLIYQWVFHIKLTGNAYWLKNQVNGYGQPLELIPLLPQYVKIIPDQTSRIKEYQYQVNGLCITYSPEEIIHFRRPHPNSFILGIGDIEPSRSLYESFITGNELQKQVYSNGAVISGVLSNDSEMLSQEEFDHAVESFRSKYEGKKNAGKTAFLTGKWSYTRLGMTNSELQSLERDKTSVEQIFINHGVPLSVAGIKDAANYATSKQDAIAFRKQACLPLADILVGKLNSEKGLTPAYRDKTLKIDYNMSGLVDIEQMVKENQPLLESGALTPNELREKCGLARIDDPYLDQYFIKSNLIPMELSGMGMGESLEESARTVVTGLAKSNCGGHPH